MRSQPWKLGSRSLSGVLIALAALAWGAPSKVEAGCSHDVVNGTSQILKPGMVGYVKPPDKIRHKTGPGGAKAVVMWVPGVEGNKIAARWTKEP